MEFTADPRGGDWIAPRLGGFGTVSGVVPRGFDAYVRIFHPFRADKYDTEESAYWTWAELARHTGRVFHPLVQAGGLGVFDKPLEVEGWSVIGPHEGALDLDALTRLAQLLSASTDTPDEVTIGIWDGWGDLHPSTGGFVIGMSGGNWWQRTWFRLTARWQQEALNRRHNAEKKASIDPRIAAAVRGSDGYAGPDLLHLPNRDYVLLRGAMADLTDPDWPYRAGIGWQRDGFDGSLPQLIWPADHAWFVGSEIDFDSTLVGCTREVADAILAASDFEALEVPLDGDLTWHGDTLNPQFAD